MVLDESDDELEEIVFESDDDVEPREPEDAAYDSDDDESEPKDDAICVFRKHTGSVFSCALHPTNRHLAVTGGEDDTAYVWDTTNGQVLLECTGFEDSVTNVSFSYDGSYFVTGDMSGVIKVWRSSTRELAWNINVADINWIKWHHGTNALLCAETSGDVYMWRIPGGEMKMIPGHGQHTECGIIMPDGRRLAVGYADGTVKLFALQTCKLLGEVAAGIPHTDISSMDARDNHIIATGGGDGRVHVFKTEPLKIVWRFEHPKKMEGNGDYIEALKFSEDPTLSLLAAGNLAGRLFILDFVKQVVRHEVVFKAGICRMLWDPDVSSGVLYAAGLDGTVRIFDGRSGYLKGQLRGHKSTILDLCFSKEGKLLMCASDDHTCRIFNINPPEH